MNTSQDLGMRAAASGLPPSCPGAGAAGRGNRVWLVDEDEAVRPLLARLLGRVEGIECLREFGSPEGLLEALGREGAPDTILLDVGLGDRDGIDFVRPIRSLAPATRVLMLTTFYDSHCASRALAAGACGYLVKSASLGEMAAQILLDQTHPELWPGRMARG